MLISYFDLFTDKKIKNEQEDLFIKKIFDVYGLCIVETHFSSGKNHDSLNIWIDFDKSKPIDDSAKRFKKINGLYPPNDYHLFTKDDVFAKNIFNLYYECFNIEKHEKKSVLYIDDWFNSVKGYTIGHAIVELRQAFFRQYGIKESRVLVFNTDEITVIADRVEYEYLLQEKEQMNFICYNFIKKHDPLNVLMPEDIVVAIRLKDDIDPIVLNGLQMRGI